MTEILRSGTGLDLRQARELTGRIIGALTAALAAGEAVELRGLGSLEVRYRAGRRSCNPKTREPVDVPPRRYVLFHPGSKLKALLREQTHTEKEAPGHDLKCPITYP
jgi:nucleoid DNA-binding protein